jgi:hypothetical protein
VSFIKNKSKGLFEMDSIKNMDKTERYHDRIKELFREFSSKESGDRWADTFDIESIDERQILVTYHGTEDIKKFKKECKITLISCIYSVIGVGRKIKIDKRNIWKDI